jgi:hypothetical protein
MRKDANETTPADDTATTDATTDVRRRGHDQARPSGDAQGLSSTEDAADESVQELADEGQGYEADVIDGVEDAADHPEQPVRSHESRLPFPPQEDGD